MYIMANYVWHAIKSKPTAVIAGPGASKYSLFLFFSLFFLQRDFSHIFPENQATPSLPI